MIRTTDSVLSERLLITAKAVIELRHFGGAKGLQMLDEIAMTDNEEQHHALAQLIAGVKNQEIKLTESN